MNCVLKDEIISEGGNGLSSLLSCMTLGEGLGCGGSSVEIRSTGGACRPSSISLGEGSAVDNSIDAASDGSKMAGARSLASLAREVEIKGRDFLSMKDQSRFKSRAMFECELQLSTGRAMAHSLRMRATKR